MKQQKKTRTFLALSQKKQALGRFQGYVCLPGNMLHYLHRSAKKWPMGTEKSTSDSQEWSYCNKAWSYDSQAWR